MSNLTRTGQIRSIRQTTDNPARGFQTGEQQRQSNAVVRRGVTSPFTVTSVSQLMLPADALRRFLFIQNNDTLGKITVAVGGSVAALGVGFNLSPGGGGILLDINCPTDNIFVIGSIASNPNVIMVVA